LPQYFSAHNLGMAIGYVEFGSFLALLVGQSFGSWAMASHWNALIVTVLIVSTLLGIYFSFRLYPAPATNSEFPRFYLNPLKDAREMYSKVTSYPKLISTNLHAIAWFWALGLITSTEFSLFTKNYLGGDGHLFSVILALFSLGLGIGTWLCAKFSNGKIVHHFVVIGGIGASVIMFILLSLHRTHVAIHLPLSRFIMQPIGIVTLLLIALYSVFCGFYSLTCYTEIQLMSNPKFRAQVIASVNILSGIYLLSAAAACAILQMFISSWWVICLAVVLNIFMVIRYQYSIKRSLVVTA
jgi:hypothetical protein